MTGTVSGFYLVGCIYCQYLSTSQIRCNNFNFDPVENWPHWSLFNAENWPWVIFQHFLIDPANMLTLCFNKTVVETWSGVKSWSTMHKIYCFNFQHWKMTQGKFLWVIFNGVNIECYTGMSCHLKKFGKLSCLHVSHYWYETFSKFADVLYHFGRTPKT